MDVIEVRTRKSSVVAAAEVYREDDSHLGLKGDYLNLCVLVLLYVLQGVPMGLLATIPMIMSSNEVPYDKQAIFSFASYPYAIKLLWAPIVDSIYSEKFGRRKSWLIPSQYCIGIALLVLSPISDDLIGNKTAPPQIYWLTFSLFVIVFVTSTQDIAVDAWGLTLLAKRNVYYVASCNSFGLVFGSFISTTLFLSLESAEFCNKWLRSVPKDTGIVNIQQFFFAAGVLFIFSTTVIWIFKSEKNVIDCSVEIDGPVKTYKLLLKIIRLKSVFWFAVLHLTQYIGMAVFISATDLKLIQFGVRREVLSLLRTPISILNLILPFFIVHKTKINPLHHFWRFGVMGQICYIATMGIVYWTESFNKPENGFPIYYYIGLFINSVICNTILFASGMSMWSYMMTIADPVAGGTYMTLYSTIATLGFKYAMTASLALIDVLTFQKKWTEYENVTLINNTHFDNTSDLLNSTIQSVVVDRNVTIVDGFYVEGVICIIYGFVWFACFKRQIWKMQSWPESKWRVLKEETSEETEAIKLSGALNEDILFQK